MGWAVGRDTDNQRFRGYGVPAYCDWDGCTEEIDRGLYFVCEGESCGCELFYCDGHSIQSEGHPDCGRGDGPEHPEWIEHVLNDDSWEEFRKTEPYRLWLHLPGEGKGRIAQ